MFGKVDCVKVLIEAGVDVDDKSLRFVQKHPNLAQLLEQRNAADDDDEEDDPFGNTFNNNDDDDDDDPFSPTSPSNVGRKKPFARDRSSEDRSGSSSGSNKNRNNKNNNHRGNRSGSTLSTMEEDDPFGQTQPDDDDFWGDNDDDNNEIQENTNSYEHHEDYEFDDGTGQTHDFVDSPQDNVDLDQGEWGLL